MTANNLTSPLLTRGHQARRAAAGAAVLGSAAAIGLALVYRFEIPSTFVGVGTCVFIAVGTWLFTSERYAATLAVLVLYLGALDGYLKLKIGASFATLGRDVLLYLICLGFLARGVVRKEPVQPPPLTGWIVAFALLVVVQVLNPGSGGFGRSLAATRPHIEFVPMFFLAYLTLRSRERMRGLMLLLIVIGAANGVVSYIQFTLSPEQLATWGPGYNERIFGTGDVAARTFQDNSGTTRVRPFGLGSDTGAGALVGLLAIPSAMALIAMSIRRRVGLLAVPLAGLVAVAIVTSQARGVIIGAVAAIAFYVGLSVIGKRLIPALASVAVIILVVVGATTFSSKGGGTGAFDRLQTITPSKFLESGNRERGGSLSLAGQYVVDYPFGAGIGSVGPASGVGQSDKGLNGETEFNFLLLELGVAGAVVFLGFNFALLVLAVTRIRKVSDPELRLMLAALAAPLFALAVLYFSGSPTSGSPAGPFYWGIAGVLVYWLVDPEGKKRAGIAS